VTPSDWYEGRIKMWSARRAAGTARAVSLSRWRLLTFLGGAAIVVFGLRVGSTALMIAGAAGFVAFGWLVVRHARVFDGVARADAAAALNAEGAARLARDWSALPEVQRPADLDWHAHPYARDLDLYGHASLTKWLGSPATLDGTRRLADWLLAPSNGEELPSRQAAVDELAQKREWRESLATEGALLHIAAEELESFLQWVESPVSAVPRVMRLIAPALTIAILTLFADFLRRVLPTWPLPAQPGQDANALFAAWMAQWPITWWMIPMTIGIVLSFVFARAIHRAFDRAALGERALRRYSAMLALVCEERFSAIALERVQSRLRQDGDAPVLVRSFTRWSGWSELRTGAALLHFPIQALTLWDFHVLHALEHWRARHGRAVRGWLDALGEIDALARLAAVRADEPAWVLPDVEPGASELRATALGHPLIAADRRIPNDVQVGPSGTLLVVTGSNMSGKSTLLRAIGLNAVLAQAGAPVCASAFRMPPARLYTSIRVEDSLEHGVSYFMAALARLKRIVDAAEQTRPDGTVLFYLLDEVLQGTNSVERAIAVRAVARHLLDAGAVGVMTTHDLALAGEEPLKSAARLAHFTEVVHPDGTMTFDYQLRPGLATSTNALRLMQLIGITPR
jgi:MutS-like protein